MGREKEIPWFTLIGLAVFITAVLIYGIPASHEAYQASQAAQDAQGKYRGQ
jgi:hypothetical protein